jgi:hypothetical protein
MEIPRYGRLIAASVIAPLVPVSMFAALNRGICGRFVVVALVVSYLHSTVGISLCLWLRRVGILSVGTVALVSALLGSMPVTLLTCSIDLPDFESVGGVVIVRDGRLTTYGYWEIVRQALSAGGSGISAGAVWFFICGSARARHD